jgi:hypothetical protein
MEPLPTPFDIIAPPTFAFVPPWSAWALPIAILTVALAVILYLLYSDKSLFFRRKRRRILISYFRDLEEVATNYTPPEAAALASTITRRFLSSIIRGQDFSSMTSREMVEYFKEHEHQSVKALVEILLPFEEQRYKKEPSVPPTQFINELRRTAYTIGEELIQ